MISILSISERYFHLRQYYLQRFRYLFFSPKKKKTYNKDTNKLNSNYRRAIGKYSYCSYNLMNILKHKIILSHFPFKVVPSRYNALVPTFLPIVETLVKFNFRNCLQSLLRSACISSIVSKLCLRSSLLSLGNSQKSHGVNQANIVVVERYALSFWRNSHEERVQYETAHYRDAKTTSCLPKIPFETVLSDPLETTIVLSIVDFDGRSGRSKSSTRPLPSLKSLYHL